MKQPFERNDYLLDRRRFLRGSTLSIMLWPLFVNAQRNESITTENSVAVQFTNMLDQLQADPELAKSSRRDDELSKALSEGLEKAPIRSPKSTTTISSRASDLIVACEVTSQVVYNARYEMPTWPEGHSGITIGIGYDIGCVRPTDLMDDWGDYLSITNINVLSPACGLSGSGAAGLLAQLPPIRVKWDAAISQYSAETRPRYVGATEAALPNTKALSADSLGALVSLVYNRGASFNVPGPRYPEMRKIRLYMKQREFDRIPAEIRAMKRLWANEPRMRGLLLRREAEASLFELGLGA